MVNLAKYENNGISLDARIEDGQAWLTYSQIGVLFGIDESTAGKHVRSIVDESELPADCAAQFAVQVAHGSSSRIVKVSFANQDAVLHVGYRVRSDRGSEFRRWATMVLKGEAPPLPVRAPTAAEQLLRQAQLMVEQERRLATIETQVASLVASQEQAVAEVEGALALPPAPVDASARTHGQMTVALLRAWAIEHGQAFQEAHRILYTAVEERPETRIDLRTRLANAKAKAKAKAAHRGQPRLCDVIDATGKSGHIYAIARQVFA